MASYFMPPKASSVLLSEMGSAVEVSFLGIILADKRKEFIFER